VAYFLAYVLLLSKYFQIAMLTTKRLQGLSRLTYAEKLHSFGAYYLELCRLQFDLVMLYNIIRRNVDVDLATFDIINFDLVRTSRGHPLRIVKSHCRINARL